VTVHKPDPRLGFSNCQIDGFDYVGKRLAVSLRGFSGLLVFLFLVEEEKYSERSLVHKVLREIPAESFQKPPHGLHWLHQQVRQGCIPCH